MWIEERQSKKGTRYKYCERFELPNGEIRKVSVIFNTNSSHARKQATIELQRKYEQAVKEIDINKVVTYYDVAMSWLEHTEPTVKRSTHINHTIYVNKIFSYIDKALPIADLTAVTLEDVLHKVYYVENLSYSYTRATFTTMKAIYKHAKRKKLIPSLIDFEDIEIKKKPFSHSDIAKKQNKFLDAVELKETLMQLSKIDSRISLLFEFVSLTGLRIGELLALRYSDYDKENATININGTIQYDYKNSSEIKRGTPKNIYSVRNVSLSDRAVSILDSIMLENKRRSLWFEGYIDHGYIFTSSRGNPYDIQFLNRRLKGVHIEGKHLTTHIFRHTHISMLAELGVPLKTIMQRVGHNDPNTTLSIYTHVTKSMHDDVINKLNHRQA
ncbi:site-specific integrase [Veillonella sp.]|jgi:integrase|uniref:tyrosine-type recombinase/integrase n=1 Tax=Veillonella sp. TaxID=1926307 RepID=UPI0007674085|nr:site-specific integrase [Veillonella sp.]KXB89280.1 site-specific recombinase, phage integrase family [Veillonella dispar]MDU4105238.1 site-specific integrase [Veillonella sp.]DAK32845.1 MAG TPA: Integrase [Caudoviricetes sp.]